MSMILALHTVADATIDRLLADPPLLGLLIAPDDPEVYLELRGPRRRGGWLARLLGRGAPAPAIPSLALAEGEGLVADLDKAWHAIHFLLAGDPWAGAPPHSFLLAGGAEIGDLDIGYGPARALRAAEVAAAHAAVQAIPPEEFGRRFDPERLQAAEIYPSIWDRDPAEDDLLGFLLSYYEELQAFLAAAVEGQLGVVVTMT
jgi:hypothetical protein